MIKGSGDTIRCCSCKAQAHIYCYNIAKPSSQLLNDNSNVFFLCDKCKSNVNLNNIDIAANVAELSVNVNKLASDFTAMNSALGEFGNKIIENASSAPPPQLFNAMSNSLSDITVALSKTSTVVEEIRNTVATLNPQQMYAEMIAKLENLRHITETSAIASTSSSDKVIGILTELRPVLAPQTNLSYANVTQRKRPRVDLSASDVNVYTTTQPRFGRTSGTEGTGPTTNAFQLGGKSSRLTNTKHLVISPLHPSTSSAQIKEFITTKLELQESSSEISVFSLAPRNRPLNELTFVSFKIETADNHYDKLMSADFWPKGINFRPFENRGPKPPIVPPFAEIASQSQSSNTDQVDDKAPTETATESEDSSTKPSSSSFFISAVDLASPVK